MADSDAAPPVGPLGPRDPAASVHPATPATPADSPPLDPRRWRALAFITLAQLMVVLDGTIVNIALPSAQRALHISDADRQWVVTAYALAFGGLLLFGGRIADRFGRRRSFMVGLIGFAAASAVGGAAVDTGMLLGARMVQGAFAALLAPAALSLLTVTFTSPEERAKAFGFYGATSGGGAAVGLLLGGALTEYADWRWTLFINVFIAAIALGGAVFEIREPQGSRNPARLDVPGILLASSGLAGLVYGFSKAQSDGWSSPVTTGFLAASVALLAAFVAVQARVANPLLPLRVVMDRNRGGAYLSLGIAVIGMFGALLFMTFYLQNVLHYSPVASGAAVLPMVVGMMVGATQISARLITRIPARLLMTPGYLVSATGLVLFAHISVDGSYPSLVLPGMFLFGLGLGLAFMAAMNLATSGVEPRDAGVASAMVSTSQQVGGAVGTSLLSTLATSATAAYAAAHLPGAPSTRAAGLVREQAMVHGFSTAFWWAAAMLVLSAAISAVLIDSGPKAAPDLPRSPGGAPVRAATH